MYASIKCTEEGRETASEGRRRTNAIDGCGLPRFKLLTIKAREKGSQWFSKRAKRVRRGCGLCIVQQQNAASEWIHLDLVDSVDSRQPVLNLVRQGRVLSHLRDLQTNSARNGVDDLNALDIHHCGILLSPVYLMIDEVVRLLYSALASAMRSLSCS